MKKYLILLVFGFILNLDYAIAKEGDIANVDELIFIDEETPAAAAEIPEEDVKPIVSQKEHPLIYAINQGNKELVKKILGYAKIDLPILKQALEKARTNQKESVAKSDKENETVFTEMIELLKTYPYRQAVRKKITAATGLPEEISSLIEEYSREDILKDPAVFLIYNLILKIKKIIKDEHWGATNSATGQLVDPNEIYKINFLEIMQLPIPDKISLLNYMLQEVIKEGMLELNKENELFGDLEEEILDYYFKYLDKIEKFSSQHVDEIWQNIVRHDIGGDIGYKIAFLIYKFIYLLLDQKTKEKYKVKSPEELKKEFYNLEGLQKL